MSTLDKFQNRVDWLWRYVKERPAQVYQHMADYFALGIVIPVSILNNEDESRSISVCETPLRTGRFDGAWFTNCPLSIKVEADDAAWTMKITHSDGKSDTYTYETTEIQPDLSECVSGDTVTFTLTHAAVTEIPSVNKKVNVESYFDLTGKKKSALHQGVNILLNSDGTRRKVIVK